MWISDLSLTNPHHLPLSEKVHAAWDLAERDNQPFSIMNCIDIARSHWAKVRETMLTMGPGNGGGTKTTTNPDPTQPKKKKRKKNKKLIHISCVSENHIDEEDKKEEEEEEEGERRRRKRKKKRKDSVISVLTRRAADPKPRCSRCVRRRRLGRKGRRTTLVPP